MFKYSCSPFKLIMKYSSMGYTNHLYHQGLTQEPSLVGRPSVQYCQLLFVHVKVAVGLCNILSAWRE